MVLPHPTRLVFHVEWLDPNSQVIWKYLLTYYPQEAEVEMYDVKNRRSFLRRSKCDTISLDRLVLGGTVTVMSRTLKLLEYADQATADAFASLAERTLAMIKPDAIAKAGDIIDAMQRAGLKIVRARMCHLSSSDCRAFYAIHAGKPFFEPLVDFMSSGRLLALELRGPNAIQVWRQLIGPTDRAVALKEAPQSLRARFGTDTTHNACHGSDGPETAAAECNFFFGNGYKVGQCAKCTQTALAVIKPHAIESGHLGAMLTDLSLYFDITALEMMAIDRTVATEFLEVYRGVIPASDFNGSVEELTSGPLVAIEVATHDGSHAVTALRDVAGPSDPELARILRPQSLRAKFGKDKVRNGLHCTDLAEDGDLEVEYFFQLLQ